MTSSTLVGEKMLWPLQSKLWRNICRFASTFNRKPTLDPEFYNLFKDKNIAQPAACLLSCLGTIDTNMYSFQYKIDDNVSFLNKLLFDYNITNNFSGLFVNKFPGKHLHISLECIHAKSLQVHRKNYLVLWDNSELSRFTIITSADSSFTSRQN